MSDGAWISLAGLSFTLFSAILGIVWRLAHLNQRVDLIWDFLMRRALSEGLAKGLVIQNSPLRVIDDKARAAYEPLLGRLRVFGEKTGRRMTERELFIELEKRFGEEMSRTVCPALELSAGACLHVAAALMREELEKPS